MRLQQKTILVLAAALAAGACAARTVADFHTGWTFTKEGSSAVSVTLPHDWAIAGPFDPALDGNTGKLPWRGWRGRGVYETTISCPELPKGRILLDFEGVMAHATVFANGNPCGRGDYGYLGFRADLTPYLMKGENKIVVKVDTDNFKSRWYPGGGIYRPVHLVKTDDVYLEDEDLYVTTKDVLTGCAEVKVKGVVTSRRLKKANGTACATLKDPSGAVVATAKDDFDVDGYADEDFKMKLKVPNPQLWELVDGAKLYTLEVAVSGEGFADSLVRRIGLREFRFDADKGFILNGKRVQLNGVDLHSDLGPLGMAFDKDAMRRQFAVMRDMGANALRTSHNCPAPGLLDLCDEMGIFVWDECFDKWQETCGRGDEPLEDFVSRQLAKFVRRDRNHPCVFAWSIGNEISIGKVMPPGQESWANGLATGTSVERCARFRHVVRAEDDTRPVGIGSCFPKAGERGDYDALDITGWNYNGMYERGDYDALDITGWNYNGMYDKMRAHAPDKPLLYTESASALSEWGYYADNLPTNKTDFAVSAKRVDSYDFNAARWSDIPDREFFRMTRDPFVGGEFVWTGIDYLGEPTPYNDSRSSYFGICDLCAFPKDRFYLYRAHFLPLPRTLEPRRVHAVPRAVPLELPREEGQDRARVRLHERGRGGALPERKVARAPPEGSQRGQPRRLLLHPAALPSDVDGRAVRAGRAEDRRVRQGRPGVRHAGDPHGGRGGARGARAGARLRQPLCGEGHARRRRRQLRAERRPAHLLLRGGLRDPRGGQFRPARDGQLQGRAARSSRWAIPTRAGWTASRTCRRTRSSSAARACTCA